MRHHHQLLITSGMIELLALYQQQNSWTGSVEKWSLMHHLELISHLLDHPKDWLKYYSKVQELYEVIQ